MFQTVVMSLNEGFVKSLEIFALTLLGAIPLGLIMSFGSMSSFKPLSGFVRTVVWIFRGSPLMIQLLLIYYAPGWATTSGAPAPPAALPQPWQLSSSTTPAISRRYSGAALRAYPVVRRRRGRYWA